MENLESKKIPVTCKGSKKLPLSDLLGFQGNLKTLHETESQKLRRSILKHGFAFPVFVWGTHILDGHQRVFVLRQMIDEGYLVDDIPVVEIKAKDRAEAAEKLLLLNSRFGEITDAGMIEFIEAFDLDLSSLELNLENIKIDEIEGFEEQTQLRDVEDEPVQRKLGDEKRKIKFVLYAKDIQCFERAILETGNRNYGEALMEICRTYLRSKEDLQDVKSL